MNNVKALDQDEVLGVFNQIKMEDYRKIPAISFSGLVRLAQSPAHYQDYLNNPPEPTSAMMLGTAIHSAILEHGLDTQTVVAAPDVDKRTKDGKARWQEFEAQNVGKIILSQGDYERVEQIALAVYKHPLASTLLDAAKGKAEQSALWKDPGTGVLCKCRTDFLRNDGIIIDVKSTSDASLTEFQRSLSNLKYHWQSAFYLDGMSLLLGERLNQFAHIVIERNPPFGIAVYVLDDASLELARDGVRLALEVYAKCLKADKWPGYPEIVQNISLPGWMWG